MGSYGIPRPLGISISQEVHEQFSPDVQAAWERFDVWWKEQDGPAGSAKRSEMPESIAKDFELIKTTQIPGYAQGITGADSCYVAGVEMLLQD